MIIISSIFFFIIAIGVLVTIHEFGHFYAARKLGVKVIKFSVGFGKALWSWKGKKDGTEYVIAALPLGGYVQMLDEREGEVDREEQHLAFNRKSVSKRFLIVAAGPIFNFILAIIAYSIVFMIGIDGIIPKIGPVSKHTIADAGGFKDGDIIVRVDGKETATWNTAFLILLDRSLGRKKVEIDVVDSNQEKQKRILDFRKTTATVDQENFMENIGFNIDRPDLAPIIGEIIPGGRADVAGLLAGDRILEADGNRIDSWVGWVEYVKARPEKEIKLKLERGPGAIERLTLVPERISTEEGEIGRIGAGVFFSSDDLEKMRTVERYSPLFAVARAINKTWDVTALTLRLLAKMIMGDISATNLGGPIRIAEYAGKSAGIGIVQYIGFIALISISLGVLNLLPIPVLDGGHLLYYLIEAVKGSPVSEAVQIQGQRIGIAIIIMIMLFAIYNDLIHIYGK